MGKKSGGRVRVKQMGNPKMANPLADMMVPPEEMINLPVKPDSNSGFFIWPVGKRLILSLYHYFMQYP